MKVMFENTLKANEGRVFFYFLPSIIYYKNAEDKRVLCFAFLNCIIIFC